MRQIILDTETTGLRVEEGHRIIEIGCLEMIDRKLTGQSFHHFFNPERAVDQGAFAVHGISDEFLADKPFFAELADAFIEFITGAELIIHNAPFDLSFLNQELKLTQQYVKSITDYCRVTDTLQLARQLHAGQRNSLDALCKRYAIDNSKREWHGALLDAHLLAQVYLAMTGGQGCFFDEMDELQPKTLNRSRAQSNTMTKQDGLIILKASESEVNAHEAYLERLRKDGKCIWNHLFCADDIDAITK
jgi:DNA polymerase-3 subunit epsilon